MKTYFLIARTLDLDFGVRGNDDPIARHFC
jgi:hypothetical protein